MYSYSELIPHISKPYRGAEKPKKLMSFIYAPLL